MAQRRRPAPRKKPMSKKRGAAIGAGVGAAVTAKNIMIHRSTISDIAAHHGKGAAWAGIAGGAALNMGAGAGIGALAAHYGQKNAKKGRARKR